jgi:hypothetical protein
VALVLGFEGAILSVFVTLLVAAKFLGFAECPDATKNGRPLFELLPASRRQLIVGVALFLTSGAGG